MLQSVTITTGSRLHIGLLAYGSQLPRQFGGAGLMIDDPGFRVTLSPARDWSIEASGETTRRIKAILAQYRDSEAHATETPACRIVVEREIPPHSGFGSGTQLSLAIAQALALLAGQGSASIIELAAQVGRGARSGIGIHGFMQGGFLVDGGKASEASVAPLIARFDVPPDWRFVLITPRQQAGLSGDDERQAFSRLTEMRVSTTDRLCRLLLTGILPALAEEDFERFSESVYEYGRVVGEYFEPAQGGVFASREMQSLAAHLREQGVRGVAQTSWGPSIFVVCSTDSEANQLEKTLRRRAECVDCDLRTVAALNTGAAIEIV